MFPCDATWCACNGISLGIAWDHFCWFFAMFIVYSPFQTEDIGFMWHQNPRWFGRLCPCSFNAFRVVVSLPAMVPSSTKDRVHLEVWSQWLGKFQGVWRCTRISIDHIQPLHLDNLQWPHCDLTGIIVSKGNYPPLAGFSSSGNINYNLPRVHSHYNPLLTVLS